MNKKGESNKDALFGFIFLGVIILISAVMVIGSLVSNSTINIGSIGETILNIFTPIAEAAFTILAPSGVDENTQVIAFSLAILVMIIGFRSVKMFLGSNVISAVVAFIIAILVGRTVTPRIIEESAFAAAPLAGISILMVAAFGFGVVKIINKKMRFASKITRSFLYIFVGLIIYVIFVFVFEGNQQLGVLFGLLIMGTGVLEEARPTIKAAKREAKGKHVGMEMGKLETTLEEAKAVTEGLDKAEEKES